MGTKILLSACMCILSTLQSSLAQNGPTIKRSESKLYGLSTTLWPSSSIHVCWENPTPSDETERAWVSTAIDSTWAKYAAIRFIGWIQCQPEMSGIHIRIANKHPHTTGLGIDLNGKKDGMVLSFFTAPIFDESGKEIFKEYYDSRKSNNIKQLNLDISYVAIHEFGHALGFAHEQTRPDTPSDCKQGQRDDIKGDIPTGPYDKDSIMNYCNETYAPLLSQSDKNGIIHMYGDSKSFPRLVLSQYGYVAGAWLVDRHPRMMADVNGDGKADIVGFGEGGVYLALSTGTGFSGPVVALPQFGAGDAAGSWSVARHPRMMADVNGDRKADIVGFGEGGVYLALSTGTGFSGPVMVLPQFGATAGAWHIGRHPRMMADVNGDGRADIVGFGEGGVYLALSTGTGFSGPVVTLPQFGASDSAGNWSVERHPRMMADVNGDGMADIVGFNESATVTSISTGTSFSAPSVFVRQYSAKVGGWQVSRHPRLLADVNGDRKNDIIGFAEAGTFISFAPSNLSGDPILQ